MKPIKQMLDISPTRMKRKLSKVTGRFAFPVRSRFRIEWSRSIMKTQIPSPAAFSNLRRVTSMTALANAVFLCGAVLSMSEAAIAQTQERSGSSPIWPFEVAKHFSRGSLDSSQPDSQAIARETTDALAGNIEQPVMTPTRSSFLAKWQGVRGAIGYRLDVSTSRSFDSYVANYRDLDLANVTNYVVTGLNRGTKYYYRVRPYSSAGIGSSSEAVSVTTASSSAGLVINPTFDSTITNDPRSNAIQAMIFSAIEKYQTLFNDP